MNVITIGRSSDNNHIINDLSVSKYNTQIIKTDDGRFVIVDMGSVNGTYVNGQRIVGEHPLKPGDVVKIANVMIDWQMLFPGEVQIQAPQKKSRGGWILSVILGSLAAALILGIVMLMLFFRNEKKEDSELKDMTGAKAIERQIEALQNDINNLNEVIKQNDEEIKDLVKQETDTFKKTKAHNEARQDAIKGLKEVSEKLQDSLKNINATLEAAKVNLDNIKKAEAVKAEKPESTTK